MKKIPLGSEKLEFLFFILGVIAVLIIQPLTEYFIGMIQSKYELFQMKDSLQKSKIQAEIQAVQNSSEPRRRIGFKDGEDTDD